MSSNRSLAASHSARAIDAVALLKPGISNVHLDLFINICLTLLGGIPGHIHAFYLLYVYYDRREEAVHGRVAARRAPGIYSDKVQTGGMGYGTMAAAPPPMAH